jgi:hypothetical protein
VGRDGGHMTDIEKELEAIKARKPVMLFTVDIQADSLITFTSINGDSITPEMSEEFNKILNKVADLLKRSAIKEHNKKPQCTCLTDYPDYCEVHAA